MDDGRPNPEESLNLVKRRVDDAKLRLDLASAYVKEVDSDDRSGRIMSRYPDAREHALRAQRSAHAEYQRVLKIYEDFVARGKAAHNGAGPEAPKARGEQDGEEP